MIAAATCPEVVAVAEDEAQPASLGSLEHAMTACRLSLDEAAEICGVPAADIAKAAEWIAKPKDDGTCLLYTSRCV